MSAGSRTKVADVAEVGDGQAKVVEVDGRSVAVFNVAGRFYAIDNLCPHRGGPLGEGDVEGAVVVCPWHGWRWDVTTGVQCQQPRRPGELLPRDGRAGEHLRGGDLSYTAGALSPRSHQGR
jgi:nitrite reductase/ring-hydroxylating ferredoxin subunit